MAFNLNLLRSNVQKNTDALRQGARKMFFGGGILGALKRPESSTSQLGSGGSWGRPSATKIANPQTQPKIAPTSIGTSNSGGSWGVSKLQPIASSQSSSTPTSTIMSPPDVSSSSSFSSSDPTVQARLAEMNAETYAKSSQSGATPQTSESSGIPSPTTPTITAASMPRETSGLSEAQKQLLALYNPSKEEKTLQDELATLRGNAQLGISGLEGQGRGIPLELVRGQQGKLEEQAAIKEGTLMDRLAAATAQRQAALQASTANLGFIQQQEADRKAAEAAQAPQAPFEFNGNLVRFNPQTGQIETIAQGQKDGTEPITLSAGQTLYDPNTGQPIYTAPGGTGAGAGGFELSPGQIRYDQYGNIIVQAPGGAGSKPTETQGRNLGFYNRAIAAETDIQSALPNVGNFLQAGLPNWMQGEDFKLYRQGAESWIKAILRQESGAAIPPDEMASYFKTYFPQFNDPKSVIDQKAASRQQAMQALQVGTPDNTGGGNQDPLGLGFNSVPSMTQNGSAQAIANAIKKVESGGNYNARGGSGESGAYQFMPATWSQWAGQYLGNAAAPMTPENQDRVAISRIQDWINQGYNPQQIALMWNGGTPVVKKGVNMYGVAYDSGAYANKVLNALG